VLAITVAGGSDREDLVTVRPGATAGPLHRSGNGRVIE